MLTFIRLCLHGPIYICTIFGVSLKGSVFKPMHLQVQDLLFWLNAWTACAWC